VKLTPISILLSSLLCLYACSDKETAKVPVAEKGIIDLSNWDFKKDGPIDLSGMWEYYPGSFYSSADLQCHTKLNQVYVPVPGPIDIKRKGLDIPQTRFGTFRLLIMLPEKIDHYSIRCQYVSNAYKLYVNSMLSGETETTGTTKTCDAASADKVGTIRYRVRPSTSYAEMCMQTGASFYAWVVIQSNSW